MPSYIISDRELELTSDTMDAESASPRFRIVENYFDSSESKEEFILVNAEADDPNCGNDLTLADNAKKIAVKAGKSTISAAGNAALTVGGKIFGFAYLAGVAAGVVENPFGSGHRK